MNILGLTINRTEKRSVDSDGNAHVYTPIPTMPFGLLDGGTRSATSLAVAYRCIRLISDSVAMMPVEIKHGNKVDSQHYLNAVFNDKNALLTRYELVKMLVQDVLMHGNGYAYILRNGPTASGLRYLSSADVQISYNKNTGRLLYKCPLVSPKPIEPCNMLHFKGYSNDGVNGIAVTQSATHLLKSAKLAEQTSEKLFEKGGRLDGILKMNQPANADAKQDAKTAYLNSISDGVAVLPYNMEYQPIQSTAASQQLEQQRRFNALCICQYFGVPPVLVGLESTNTYGSVESLLSMFVQQTLQPYVASIEAELNRKLLKTAETDYRIDLDENALLRTDKTNAANYYSSLVSAGIMSVNESRRELGLDAVEGGDELVIAYSKVSDNKLNQTDNND